MSSTARVVVFHGAGRPLELLEFPIPVPHGAELLVRITACTICGSDLHSFAGRRTVALPTVLGHEILGRIETFGPTAARNDAAGREFKVGDRATWSLVANCGTCFYCQRGLPQKCERSVKYGHEVLASGREFTGGLADVCLLAEGTAVYRIPDHLPDEAACPANCATATVAAMFDAVTAHDSARIEGRIVLVLGAGMLGLTACAMARFQGAGEVVCCEVNAERRERAREFGASQISSPDELPDLVRRLSSGRGVDIVLELSGAAAAFELAMPLLRLGGTMVLAGSVFPAPAVPLELEQVVRRNLTIRGVHNYAPHHLQAAVDFLAAPHGYSFASLVTDWFPLISAEAAFQQARTSGAHRVGIRP